MFGMKKNKKCCGNKNCKCHDKPAEAKPQYKVTDQDREILRMLLSNVTGVPEDKVVQQSQEDDKEFLRSLIGGPQLVKPLEPLYQYLENDGVITCVDVDVFNSTRDIRQAEVPATIVPMFALDQAGNMDRVVIAHHDMLKIDDYGYVVGKVTDNVILGSSSCPTGLYIPIDNLSKDKESIFAVGLDY